MLKHSHCCAKFASALRVRRADWPDALLLYQWANEPECRVMALNSDVIPWGHHLNWFSSRVNSDVCSIYIGEMVASSGESLCVGQVRFEVDQAFGSNAASVDIYICGEFRGKGFAKRLLKESMRQYNLQKSNYKIVALAKAANFASIRLFTHSGFDLSGGCSIGSELCYRFEYAFSDS